MILDMFFCSKTLCLYFLSLHFVLFVSNQGLCPFSTLCVCVRDRESLPLLLMKLSSLQALSAGLCDSVPRLHRRGDLLNTASTRIRASAHTPAVWPRDLRERNAVREGKELEDETGRKRKTGVMKNESLYRGEISGERGNKEFSH